MQRLHYHDATVLHVPLCFQHCVHGLHLSAYYYPCCCPKSLVAMLPITAFNGSTFNKTAACYFFSLLVDTKPGTFSPDVGTKPGTVDIA